MSDFTTKLEDGVVSIELDGRLDASLAPKLSDKLKEIIGEEINKVVFFAEKLTFISSAGLRVIVFAKQKLGNNVEVLLISPPEDVVDVIEMTGFSGFLTIQDSY